MLTQVQRVPESVLGDAKHYTIWLTVASGLEHWGS